jgi:hypothetical protein|tara:strand:+ start:10 stop:255 length:246 start_codon:yes stop_codon:yes gene_type:complete
MNIYQYSEKEQIMAKSTKLDGLDFLRIEKLLWDEGSKYFDLYFQGKGKDEKERLEYREKWRDYRRLSDIFGAKRRRAFSKK